MRKWDPERLDDFPEVTWLVSVRVVGTPSWVLTPDPSFSEQISSSPLPSGPTQRRLSVSASIGGDTGLVSCVLPEELFTQILAERIQVRPHPPAQRCRAHTSSPCCELRFSAITHPQQLRTQGSWRGKMGFFTLFCPFDTALVSLWPWLSPLPETTHLKGPVGRR